VSSFAGSPRLLASRLLPGGPARPSFIIETEHNVRRTLVIPKVTFEVVDFPALCNAELVDVLKAARGGRITLTPEGPYVHE
jgi:hypothetical protein